MSTNPATSPRVSQWNDAMSAMVIIGVVVGLALGAHLLLFGWLRRKMNASRPARGPQP